VELLLFEWKPRSFVPVALASATAGAARRYLLGLGPIFPVQAHPLFIGPSGLAACVFAGLAAGTLSMIMTKAVYASEDAFQRLPIHWMWWPAIGGLVIGAGGFLFPQALGVGYDTIAALLQGDVPRRVILGILLVKSTIWAVSLGSGTSGGVLAPLFIIGGALGAGLGQFTSVGDVGLWAMVGMAAIMGGTMRSPLTGMFFLLELTNDINALPALLCGSVAALAVTVLLLKRSILTEKLARRGQHIAREYSVDILELMRVRDVMETDVPLIPANTPLPRFAARVASGDPLICSHQGTLLGDEKGELAGIITRGDVVRAFDRSRDETLTVLAAGSTNLRIAYPDETLHDAVARMLRHDIGRLPVVERTNEKKVVGYLGRSAILAARERYHRDEEVRARGFRSNDEPITDRA